MDSSAQTTLGEVFDFFVKILKRARYVVFEKRFFQRRTFFLSGSPLIQNRTSNQIWGTPSFEAQNGPLKPPPTYLGVKVHNLQILQIVDLPGMSTSSNMPFHNHASKLVHWFLNVSQAQQNRPRGLIFVEYCNTL